MFIYVLMQKNTVAHDEGHNLKLEEKLLLKDAISDLPAVCLIITCFFLHMFAIFYNIIYLFTFYSG